MNGAHPDLDTLADAAEGLLEPGQAAQVSEHVATCATCADQIASLEHVRTMLRELPELPMPPEVATRLEATLAAARLQVPVAVGASHEAASTAPGPAHASGTVLPMAAGRRHSRRWSLTVAGSVAASVVVLVAVAVSLHGTNTGDRTTAASGTSERVSGTQLPTVTHSGRTYTQANLATAVPELLGPAADLSMSATAPKAPAVAGGSTAQTMSDAAADPLTACVNSLDPGTTPLAIDIGTFDGKPATVIVLPDVDGSRVDVWVMDSPCRADSFLLYAKVPRS